MMIRSVGRSCGDITTKHDDDDESEIKQNHGLVKRSQIKTIMYLLGFSSCYGIY